MSSEATTSTPTNEELVRRLFEEVFAQGDREAANAIIHPEFVLHDRELAPDPQLSGVGLIEDLITSTQDFFTLDPFIITDFKVEVEEYLAVKDDRVVTRFRC
jgi:hypothetical protein